MALRPSRLMEERLREILTRDQTGVGEGFSAALTGDLARVLGDYFELTSPPVIAVTRSEDGGFEVRAEARASAVKRFRTTEELLPPEPAGQQFITRKSRP